MKLLNGSNKLDNIEFGFFRNCKYPSKISVPRVYIHNEKSVTFGNVILNVHL